MRYFCLEDCLRLRAVSGRSKGKTKQGLPEVSTKNRSCYEELGLRAVVRRKILELIFFAASNDRLSILDRGLIFPLKMKFPRELLNVNLSSREFRQSSKLSIFPDPDVVESKPRLTNGKNFSSDLLSRPETLAKSRWRQ